MAMTKCAECGHAISTLATTCPSCGAPRATAAAQAMPLTQPLVRRPFKIAAGVVGILLASLIVFAIINPRPIAIPPPPMPVSLEQLQSAYAQNTGAADGQFKGRALLLTAVVQSINTGLGGVAYLVLGASNQFIAPQAELADSDRGQAASLRQGSVVQLLCTGAGDIAKTPMLSDCHLQ